MQKLKPGRQLDIQIGMRVMRWAVTHDTQKTEPEVTLDGLTKPLPRFSTELSAARQAVDEVEAQGKGRILVSHNRPDGLYSAYLDYPADPDWVENGETEAHALCLAALHAIKNQK
jgi:hypothetical protein